MTSLKISLFAIVAIVMGIAGSAFTASEKTEARTTDYYFEFLGADGQEDLPQFWKEIDFPTYLASSCSEIFRGCMLTTTSVQTIGSDLHPSQVDVRVDGPNKKSPITSTSVIEVKNKAASY